MRTVRHDVEFCVVGGGMAGLCAAVAAARLGVKTVLMHDRPVLGGNASSEVRMWICGASAHGENLRETGIIEEIQLENLYRNNYPNYSVWDSILYEKAAFQENLTLLLNCSCCGAETIDGRIFSVKGWQLTTETWHEVKADYFADCSGDSILAPLTGAEFRQGREASSEFNESIAPENADQRTMGMSCLIQARETGKPQKFIPPKWAYKYDEDFFTKKFGEKLTPYKGNENFWWLEIGGMGDTVHDAEKNRDELLKIAFGVWDFFKNGTRGGAENWALEWVGFLPGKRESRRYVGDHILTQNDVRAEGRFDDIIAYGGWSMDDHYPEGFYHHGGIPTIFHHAPAPYGIPYRSLYSKNIKNLFFAGRNISVTHTAMSSSRVISTCSILGQAVGTAAAMAVKYNLSPRGVYEKKISELQDQLMDDDCYLPWEKRNVGKLALESVISAISGDPAAVINGVDRPVGKELNAWLASVGDYLDFTFNAPRNVSGFRLILDSNIKIRILNMPCDYPAAIKNFAPPTTLVSDFRIETMTPAGQWETAAEIKGNYQRFIKLNFKTRLATAVRLRIDKTHGEETVSVFAAEPL
jgi:hypothetical protein